VQKVDNRIQLIDPVFDWCAAEHKCVPAPEPFDSLGSLRAPVLDPLCFIEHDNVWAKQTVNLERVAHHLFVINDRKKRGALEGPEPFAARTEDQPVGECGETLDLFF